MSRAILLDAAPAPGRANAGAVITLSAGAEYACRLADVPHRDLSAIASEEQLAALQDDYWWAQVEWLALLERRLIDASPSLQASGWRPVFACGYLLKLLLDTVFVRAYQSAALTRGDWSELVHRARSVGPPLLGEVLPLFCESRGIEYTRQTVSGGAPVPAPTTVDRMRLRAGPIARAAVQAVEGRPRLGKPREEALNLVLLCAHYDSADLLRSNAKAGGRSALVVQDRLLKLRRGAPHITGAIPSGSVADAREWRRVADAVSRDADVLAWPSSWFEGQVGPIVTRLLADWIASVMPDVMASARWFTELYATDRVDAVVTPYLSNGVEVGAFVAARVPGGPKAVLIEHGDIAYAAPSWDLNLLAADVVVAPTLELAGYLTARGEEYEAETADVVVGSYRWQRYAKLAGTPGSHRRRPAPATELGHFDERKPTLVYLVTALAADGRYLNNAWYPDPWYFTLQAAIVDALARHERFNVVVKLFPSSEHDLSPLADYVAGKGANVMVSRAPFSSWIPWADRVVADLASTGLYETLVARRPAIGLLWEHHVARPGAIEALGPALVPFSTVEDAGAAVTAFAAATRPPRADLRPEGPEILETLALIASRSRAR